MIKQTPYPWQSAAWSDWQTRLSTERMPHAVLLHGSHGNGFDDFVLRACCSLLCAEKEKPCLDCKLCRLFLSGNHPDYFVVEAEQKQIRVDQIRAAIDFLHLSRHYSRSRLVLIKEAEYLNYAAANSLLKTLEEPPPQSIILLASYQPSSLPMTIRSRCQRIYVAPARLSSAEWLAAQQSITLEEAKAALTNSQMRPLDILDEDSKSDRKIEFYNALGRLLDDQIALQTFVEQWHEQSAEEMQYWLLEYLQQAIISKFSQHHTTKISPISKRAGIKKLLYKLHARQIERCRLVKKTNINPRLLLESSLLEWRNAHRLD